MPLLFQDSPLSNPNTSSCSPIVGVSDFRPCLFADSTAPLISRSIVSKMTDLTDDGVLTGIAQLSGRFPCVARYIIGLVSEGRSFAYSSSQVWHQSQQALETPISIGPKKPVFCCSSMTLSAIVVSACCNCVAGISGSWSALPPDWAFVYSA